MRTIKFRGKDIETGEWIYGHFFQRLGHYPAIVEPRPRDGKVMYYEIAVEDTTVGQFTEMLNKNGKEIYEGDILQEIGSGKTVLVVYEAPQFCYADNSFGYKFLNLPENYTVIGNIHDNPDYIQIENVEEFMSWGDVDENGKPVSMDKGKSYTRWVRNVKKYGYNFDYRILNAADYGAYTSRKRFFGIFGKKGLPITFPEATHSKEGTSSLFGTLEKWRPVRECLDFDDEGDSIFGRKKPLVEATLERIYAGLIKFVAGGKDAFIVKYNSVNKRTGKHIPPSIDEPCPTVATQNRLGLAKVSFLSKQFSGDPMSKNVSVEAPAGAITCKDHHAIISAEKFIVNYRFNNTGHSIEDPSPTICTVGQIGIASCNFIDVQYGNGTERSCEHPAPTLTTKDKCSLVTVKRFLMNPQYSSAGGSVDKPCFTLIARMDKMPPYLVATESGEAAIEVYPTDSPMTVKIKEFMALYGIVDIKMRMLKIPELKKIMGFPEDYVLVGTQAEQKKYIGNAVEVTIARRWCEALCAKLKEHFKNAA